jgi:hypothetical protein
MAELLQSIAQIFKRAVGTEVEIAKGLLVAEELFIDQRGQAVQFEQRVLNRCGCEQKFRTIRHGPLDALRHFVACAKDIAEFMRLIDDHEVPWYGAQFGAVLGGKMDRDDQERAGINGIMLALPAQRLDGFGGHDQTGQVEFVGQLLIPLFAQGRRANNQQTPSAFCPVLAKDETGFDGFAQPNLVGQQGAF